MPVFEYCCEACGAEFEELVRSARPEDHPACPECGRRQVSRKLSVFSARSAAVSSPAASAGNGGCGRCGDPNGPCGL